MPLTPIDVQQKTFGTALRGYDLDEVDDFLDEIVTSLKDYEQRLRDALERISALESEATTQGDAEGAIARALVAAQRSADAIVEEARSDASRIVADARSQADDMVVQRQREAADSQAEVDRLREVVGELRRRVRALADDLDGSIGEMSEAIDEAEESLAAPATESDRDTDPDSAWQPAEAAAEPEPTPAYQPFSGDASTHGRHATGEWEPLSDASLEENSALESLERGSDGDESEGQPADAAYETPGERVTRPWEED